MDYRALLVKYMAFVGQEEGVDFVSHFGSSSKGLTWTEAEIAELKKISKEAARL